MCRIFSTMLSASHILSIIFAIAVISLLSSRSSDASRNGGRHDCGGYDSVQIQCYTDLLSIGNIKGLLMLPYLTPVALTTMTADDVSSLLNSTDQLCQPFNASINCAGYRWWQCPHEDEVVSSFVQGLLFLVPNAINFSSLISPDAVAQFANVIDYYCNQGAGDMLREYWTCIEAAWQLPEVLQTGTDFQAILTGMVNGPTLCAKAQNDIPIMVDAVNKSCQSQSAALFTLDLLQRSIHALPDQGGCVITYPVSSNDTSS